MFETLNTNILTLCLPSYRKLNKIQPNENRQIFIPGVLYLTEGNIKTLQPRRTINNQQKAIDILSRATVTEIHLLEIPQISSQTFLSRKISFYCYTNNTTRWCMFQSSVIGYNLCRIFMRINPHEVVFYSSIMFLRPTFDVGIHLFSKQNIFLALTD